MWKLLFWDYLKIKDFMSIHRYQLRGPQVSQSKVQTCMCLDCQRTSLKLIWRRFSTITDELLHRVYCRTILQVVDILDNTHSHTTRFLVMKALTEKISKFSEANSKSFFFLQAQQKSFLKFFHNDFSWFFSFFLDFLWKFVYGF